MHLGENFRKIAFLISLLHAMALAEEKKEKNIPTLLKIKEKDWQELWAEKGIIVTTLPQVMITPTIITWKEVMVQHENKKLEELEVFLGDYSYKITRQDNYNPFNYLNFDNASVTTANNVVRLMTQRGADINQRERLFNIEPVCANCRDKEEHACMLTKEYKILDYGTNEIHMIFVDRAPYYSKSGAKRSDYYSNAGLFELYSNPLWNIIKKHRKSNNLKTIIETFIDNKANVNSENILVQWFGEKYSNNQIKIVESLLEYVIDIVENEIIKHDIINLLVNKGAHMFTEQSPDTILIDNQKFNIRWKQSFNLFKNLGHLGTGEKDNYIKNLIENHEASLKKFPNLPIFLHGSAENQLLWFEKIIKGNKRITLKDIKKVSKGIFNYCFADEHLDNIKKVLNCFLDLLSLQYYRDFCLFLFILRKISPTHNIPPKPVMTIIAKFCSVGWNTKLESMLEGMTTIKTYLRPDKKIRLYDTRQDYHKDIENFLQQYYQFPPKS